MSRKLCARFVSDAPPEGCVRVAVAAWTRTDGDMREVVRAILTSDAFWDPAYRNAKFKTPLEFVASAVRAVGGVPDTSLALAQVVGRLGQPLFLQPAPTGFPEDEAAWVNTGALLERLTVGLAIAAGRAPGVRLPDVPAVAFAGDVDALVGDVNRTVLQGRAGVHTLGALRRQIAGLGDRTTARVVAIGLALGSPEFQRQ